MLVVPVRQCVSQRSSTLAQTPHLAFLVFRGEQVDDVLDFELPASSALRCRASQARGYSLWE